MTPALSVVMTSYNHEAYIENAVRSAWQSYSDVEVVVSDDCSTDATVRVLERLQAEAPCPMRVNRNQRNVGATRNVALAAGLATGDMISILSTDDWLMPGGLAPHVEAMRADPQIEVVYGNGHFWKDGQTLQRVHQQDVARLLERPASEVLDFLYTHPSPLFLQGGVVRRRFLEASGGWDETMLADDWVLTIRLFRLLVSEGKRAAFLDVDALRYRVHSTNLHGRFARHSLLKLQVAWRYTPWRLKRAALSNIVFDIGLHAALLRRRRLAFALLGLSQVLGYQADRPEQLRRFLKTG